MYGGPPYRGGAGNLSSPSSGQKSTEHSCSDLGKQSENGVPKVLHSLFTLSSLVPELTRT